VGERGKFFLLQRPGRDVWKIINTGKSGTFQKRERIEKMNRGCVVDMWASWGPVSGGWGGGVGVMFTRTDRV